MCRLCLSVKYLIIFKPDGANIISRTEFVLACRPKTKRGGWEYYCKYIEQNCFCYFHCMQFTTRCVLAVVALNDCHKVVTARIHLSVLKIQRK